MICQVLTTPDGTRAIVCSTGRRARCACGATADLACDWKVTGRKSGTCDRPLCAKCSVKPAPDKDLCSEHAASWRTWQARRDRGA